MSLALRIIQRLTARAPRLAARTGHMTHHQHRGRPVRHHVDRAAERAAIRTAQATGRPVPVPVTGRPVGAAATARARPGWDAAPLARLLAKAVLCFAETDAFHGMPPARDDQFVWSAGAGIVGFRRADGRIVGTFEARRARLRIAGADAGTVMRDVVTVLCRKIDGRPQITRVASGPHMMHVATVRLPGGRAMQFAACDGGRDAEGRPTATLLLRPRAAGLAAAGTPTRRLGRSTRSA